tara:strand:+ start:769 stop:1023 length:255 start_codon:yes stop_codon:yes gene_type:complete
MSSNSKEEVFAQIKEITVTTLGIEAADIKMDSKFIDDLGADSLDVVELVMTFEEEFDVAIADEKAGQIITVGDAIKYIIDEQTK